MIKKILPMILLSCFIFADFDLCEYDNFSTQTITMLKEAGLCDEQNITKSINVLVPLAKQNNSRAEFALGEIYLYGLGGIARDFKQAYKMHGKAYIHGIRGSAVPLGKMNLLAQGREQNCNKGIELLDGVKQIPDASFILGLLHYSTLCGDVNLSKAENYFKYAAENNQSEAQYYYAELLTRTNSRKDMSKVEKWITSSAKNGFSKAQVALGYTYLDGDDVNYTKAKYWIKKAKDQNDFDAIEFWNKYELWKY